MLWVHYGKGIAFGLVKGPNARGRSLLRPLVFGLLYFVIPNGAAAQFAAAQRRDRGKLTTLKLPIRTFPRSPSHLLRRPNPQQAQRQNQLTLHHFR